ncbi:hypothetical protein DVDV_3479 [Desulfovibrio sp. DV]|nr:hypothetical protein DVDV_3479 [Desulfovibrio sp. DV]
MFAEHVGGLHQLASGVGLQGFGGFSASSWPRISVCRQAYRPKAHRGVMTTTSRKHSSLVRMRMAAPGICFGIAQKA